MSDDNGSNVKHADIDVLSLVELLKAQIERCADDRDVLSRALVLIANCQPGWCECRGIAEEALRRMAPRG